MTDDKSTPIDNLYTQGQIDKPLACIKLNERDADVGGELILGGCDVEADYWVPVEKTGFWQVNLTKVEVKTPSGEVKATFCGSDRPCSAIFDTGANVLSKNHHEKIEKNRNNLKLKLFFFFKIHCYITSWKTSIYKTGSRSFWCS